MFKKILCYVTFYLQVIFVSADIFTTSQSIVSSFEPCTIHAVYCMCMLKLSEAIIGKPVLSLRTGRTVATITGALINPNNLKIEGFYCTDSYDRSELLLLYQDIRDVLPQGFIINDHDVLAHPKDLVRLKQYIDLGFEVIGKHVVTVSHQRLGKVAEYAVEVETMYIQKIYVTQGLFKGLTGGNLGIDRSQVSEVTDSKIIVFDPLDKATVRATATA